MSAIKIIACGVLLAWQCHAAAQNLETIIVVAERSPTSLWQTPSLTSLVTQAELDALGLTHPSDYLQTVPGLWVSRGDGQEHLTALRSPVFTGAGSCGAFWMAQDGIALRAKGFCNANQLFDAHFNAAARVEVYKGPNASLFGSNAQFGGVNIVLPEAAAVTSQLDMRVSSLGYREFNSESGWANQQQALAFWGTAMDDEGWRDDAGFSQQKISAKHQWQGSAWQSQSGLNLMHLEQETAGYIEGQDAYKDDDIRTSNANPEAFRDADSALFYSRWQRDYGNGKLSLTPYFRHNEMAFLMHFVPWQPLETNGHDSLGLTAQWLQPFANGGHWFALLEAEQTQAELLEYQTDAAPFTPERFPQGVHYDYSVDAHSTALAVGFNWPLVEALTLDASARYDRDGYDYHNRTADGWACAEGVTLCRFFRPADREDIFDNSSAQLGLSWQLAANAMVFAKVADGFRIPQASELYRAQADALSEVESERIQSVELGARGVVGHVQMQTAYYLMANRHGIYQDPMRNYVNGVKTRHQGVEYELQWLINDAWRFKVAGEFAKHTYTNNPSTLGVDNTQNIADNLVDTAPRQQHSASASWQATPQLNFDLQWLYMSSYYLDPENNYSYPGHELWHLRANWQAGAWQWRFAIHNLFDQYYADRADVSFGEPRYFPGSSRHLSVGVAYTF